MSEPRARDVIAGVLGEHYPSKVFRPVPGKGLTSVCNCGELVPVSNVLSVSADYAPHRADALIAAGVSVPAEPEWGPDGSGSYGFGDDVSCDERGRVWLADNDMEPHEALGIAAALLGAANKAEGVTMPAPPEFDGRCQQPVAARGSRPCVLDIGHDGGCF